MPPGGYGISRQNLWLQVSFSSRTHEIKTQVTGRSLSKGSYYEYLVPDVP